jgi:hypothetical protein
MLLGAGLVEIGVWKWKFSEDLILHRHRTAYDNRASPPARGLAPLFFPPQSSCELHEYSENLATD